MIIEEGIVAYLKTIAAITTLTSTRFYPLELPEQPVALAAITYQKISGSPLQTMGGISGVASPRFQITCWDTTYAKAKVLKELVRLAMDSFIGTMGTVGVLSSTLEDETDLKYTVEKNDRAGSR